MSRPGLASGFVVFGTTAHKILLLLHEHGRLMHSDFVEEDIGTAANIGMALTKLRRYGFIYPVGKVSKYETGAAKSQMLYTLHKNHHNRLAYAPATQAQRDAARSPRRRSRRHGAPDLLRLWGQPC